MHIYEQIKIRLNYDQDGSSFLLFRLRCHRCYHGNSDVVTTDVMATVMFGNKSGGKLDRLVTTGK